MTSGGPFQPDSSVSMKGLFGVRKWGTFSCISSLGDYRPCLLCVLEGLGLRPTQAAWNGSEWKMGFSRHHFRIGLPLFYFLLPCYSFSSQVFLTTSLRKVGRDCGFLALKYNALPFFWKAEGRGRKGFLPPTIFLVVGLFPTPPWRGCAARWLPALWDSRQEGQKPISNMSGSERANSRTPPPPPQPCCLREAGSHLASTVFPYFYFSKDHQIPCLRHLHFKGLTFFAAWGNANKYKFSHNSKTTSST